MTEIILLRHGMTDNPKGYCIGRSGKGLNEEGRHQTEILAEWLKEHENIMRIVSSPLARAVQTAEIISKVLGIEYETAAELNEIDTGSWDGRSFAEIRESEPEEYEKRGQNPWHYRIPGGETFEEVSERAFRYLHSQDDRKTLYVTHKGVITSLYAKTGMIPEEEIMGMSCPHLAMAKAVLNDGMLEMEMPYRPDVLLDDAYIRKLWQKQNVPEHIIRHMQAVAECAGEILAGCGNSFDSERIRRACLLHDLCRKEPHHARAAADLLKKEGFPEIAAMIESHHREEYDPRAALSDADIVWYADKCVLEDRPVTIEERFAASRKKCLSEEALMHHQRRYEKALWIRQMLEKEKNHETDEN